MDAVRHARGRGPRADPSLGARPGAATRPPCAASCARPSPTTTSAHCSVGCRCSPTSTRRRARCGTRSPGYGPLQQYFDDPTVEEIWINEPARVFVARRGVAELTTTLLVDDQVRDLVERMLKSSGRRVDLSSPVRRRRSPRRQSAARRHPRHHPRPLGRQRPQVRRQGRLDSTTSSRSGTLTRQAARFLEAAVRGRPQRPRRRRHAGRQDHPAQLPGVGRCPPRERVVTCEEVFELRIPHRDVACDAVPAADASRARARSRCGAWSRRRCGCGPRASSSARCARRSASTCSSP